MTALNYSPTGQAPENYTGQVFHLPERIDWAGSIFAGSPTEPEKPTMIVVPDSLPPLILQGAIEQYTNVYGDDDARDNTYIEGKDLHGAIHAMLTSDNFVSHLITCRRFRITVELLPESDEQK